MIVPTEKEVRSYSICVVPDGQRSVLLSACVGMRYGGVIAKLSYDRCGER